MKHFLTTISLICAFYCSNAQNNFPPNGYVSIGTETPIEALTVGDYGGSIAIRDRTTLVSGTSSLGKLKFYDYNSEAASIALEHNYYFGGTPRAMLFSVNGAERLRITSNGNIGMNTTTPLSQLHVKGAFSTGSYGITNTAISVYSSEPANIGSGGAIALGGKSGNSTSDYPFAFIMGGKESNLSENYAGYFVINTVSPGGNGEVNSGNYERLRITSIGNVGIGTNTPTEKLAVNGKIRAKEIKVEAAPWPDYVFTKDYQLPTLQQTEKHIKERGHLPGIPSAEEVKANGIDLGEMNAKLLQKIEELTLHLIEMEKKNEKQQAQIDKLNSDRK